MGRFAGLDDDEEEDGRDDVGLPAHGLLDLRLHRLLASDGLGLLRLGRLDALAQPAPHLDLDLRAAGQQAQPELDGLVVVVLDARLGVGQGQGRFQGAVGGGERGLRSTAAAAAVCCACIESAFF